MANLATLPLPVLHGFMVLDAAMGSGRTLRTGVTTGRLALTHVCCLSLVTKRDPLAQLRGGRRHALRDRLGKLAPNITLLRFILTHNTSFEARHPRLLVDTKLDLSARVVNEHSGITRTMGPVCVTTIRGSRARMHVTAGATSPDD